MPAEQERSLSDAPLAASPSADRRRRAIGLVAAAGAVVLAVAAAGAGVFIDFQPRRTESSTALRRALVGACAAAALAALAFAIVAWLRRRQRIAFGALTTSVLAALIAIAISIGAALGAASSPTDDTAATTTTIAAPSPGGGSGPLDGAAAIDARTGIAYLDTNRDGRFDTPLVPCPPSTPSATGDPAASVPSTTLPPYRVGDRVRIVIDIECDGVIDQVIYAEVLPEVGLGDRPTPSTLAPPEPEPDPAPERPDRDDDNGSSGLGQILVWFLLAAAIVGIVVGVVLALRAGRRRAETPVEPPAPMPAPEPEPAPTEEDLAASSLASSAEALADDDDPRQAIINAYAVLLGGLESAGFGRHDFEAPVEHLRRALTTLRIPAGPMNQVTNLFLAARFSEHPMTESDREAARTALGEAELHLRRRAAERA